MTVQLHLGILPAHRQAAARLYWQAFGGKLSRVLGPEDKALAYLDRVIRPDHAIAATENGALLGLAGFRTPEGGFAEGSLADLRAVYGRFGASWRMAALTALSHEIDNGRFLIDGICVAPAHRNRGIGAALIDALCTEAARRGYGAIRLEVIDSNLRARALYERKGFRALRRDHLGVLQLAFRFASATIMVRSLR